MSSILTNNGAMVALQTLKTINMDMEGLQNKISTGKKVSNASDNSAVWAIAKTMESDVGGFKAVSESLALGSSKVAVAQNAAESITDLLIEVKGKIAAAQDATTDDRAKLQTDIGALRDQVIAVVEAAQFNGTNLIDGGAGASILSSLNRDSAGNVSSESITVANQDLATGGYTLKAAFTGSAGASTAADTFATTLAANSGTAVNVVIVDPTYAAGDSISISIGDETVSHTVTAEDVASTSTHDLIATSLKSKIDELGIEGLVVDYNAANAGTLAITTNGGTGTTQDLTLTGQFTNAGSGGLGALAGINVSSNASGALTTIEGLIDTARDASANLGSAAGRINKQAAFISNLSDSLTSGVGSLVDADMEKASARLKALQTQQQLGAQALSIANSAPQALLTLFR